MSTLYIEFRCFMNDVAYNFSDAGNLQKLPSLPMVLLDLCDPICGPKKHDIDKNEKQFF